MENEISHSSLLNIGLFINSDTWGQLGKALFCLALFTQRSHYRAMSKSLLYVAFALLYKTKNGDMMPHSCVILDCMPASWNKKKRGVTQ